MVPYRAGCRRAGTAARVGGPGHANGPRRRTATAASSGAVRGGVRGSRPVGRPTRVAPRRHACLLRVGPLAWRGVGPPRTWWRQVAPIPGDSVSAARSRSSRPRDAPIPVCRTARSAHVDTSCRRASTEGTQTGDERSTRESLSDPRRRCTPRSAASHGIRRWGRPRPTEQGTAGRGRRTPRPGRTVGPDVRRTSRQAPCRRPAVERGGCAPSVHRSFTRGPCSDGWKFPGRTRGRPRVGA